MTNPYAKAPYRYACTLSWGGDEPTAELEVECSYTVAWGQPESGRYGGPPEDFDPGSGDVVECIKILTVDGKPWPVDVTFGFLGELATYGLLADKLLDDHEEAMILEAIEAEAARADDASDDRFERMREEMIHDDLD
jgi:hypothetical protein